MDGHLLQRSPPVLQLPASEPPLPTLSPCLNVLSVRAFSLSSSTDGVKTNADRATHPFLPVTHLHLLVELLGWAWVTRRSTSMGRCAVAAGASTRLWPKTNGAEGLSLVTG